MDISTYLYHYTNINSLALILKTQKVRFTRLDKVNDTQEGLTNDFGSFATYLFVCCFTETKEENLAMWNMYTPEMRGVRIQFEAPVFNFYKIGKNDKCLVAESEIVDEVNNIFIVPHPQPFYKIEYTDNPSKLKPLIVQQNGLYLKDVGTCKKTIWAIENEWRFRLNIFPIDPNVSSDYFPDKYNHLLTKKQSPSVLFYDLKINDDVFKNIKILLGPKLQFGDREIVEALVEKYNHTAQIEISSLNGFIQ
jgi:hypothetical protein